MSLEDFMLDRRQMRPGTKVALTGLYRKDGDYERLGSDYRGTYAEPTYAVGLLTENAPRDARKRLLDLGARPECQLGICKLRVLGHVAPCVVTPMGRAVKETVFLAMEELW
jgi:Fe2+ transport system protein FeoA